MDYIDFTRQKVFLFHREVGRVRTSDFHHAAAKECLSILERIFAELAASLNSRSARRDDDIRRNACIRANVSILIYQELLGFLLRSTNVRNPFELYEPIYQIARDLLGRNARLILSSEWKFSPFTYPAAFKDLPGFAFIGLPATESENVLIIPLTGHELGHSVWRVHKVAEMLAAQVKTAVLQSCDEHWAHLERVVGRPLDRSRLETDLELRSLWVTPFQWSMRQCEEVFCDLLGIRIFGQSYLHAFEYLVSPNFGPSRVDWYPPLDRRIHYMVLASNIFGFEAPTDFKERFVVPRGHHRSGLEQGLLAISHRATDRLFSAIVNLVSDLSQSRIPMPDGMEAERIFGDLQAHRPSDGPSSLPDVINAGWRTFLTGTLKFDGLNELLCKTMEVAEFRRKTRGRT